ncbi:hypothetical protein HanPI659440_Chr09g0328281 [Helianthus annuus]|nr:hypothetical protein HanPI659440_Chr17g0700241 [Helianthus annuus]KAJ0752783.1 hypothetical protein HanPI659440_Chr09g0328281 [Helianthus annuus]
MLSEDMHLSQIQDQSCSDASHRTSFSLSALIFVPKKFEEVGG